MTDVLIIHNAAADSKVWERMPHVIEDWEAIRNEYVTVVLTISGFTFDDGVTYHVKSTKTGTTIRISGPKTEGRDD